MANTAAILNPSGKKFWVKYSYALHLVEAGDHEVICEKPLTVKPIPDGGYRDEVRRCSGRVVTGIVKMPFNGAQSSTSGYRVKPPRPEFDFWTWLNHQEDTGWADVSKSGAQRRIVKHLRKKGEWKGSTL